MEHVRQLIAVVMLLPASIAHAQQAQYGCKDPLHRQFDFWVGEWTVSTPDGQPLGKNVITVIQDGCALQESWSDARGGTGTSINYVEGDRGHQLWVSNRTGAWPLNITGGLEGGAMVMSGDYVRTDGKRVKARMRWEPIGGGKVRQTWENSEDGGRTWTTLFLGVYTRVSTQQSLPDET
jgi:hypothetical protein